MVGQGELSSPALRADEIWASYASRRERDARTGSNDVLRNVSFDIAPGELVVVIGPNGAGKSTLLRVLSGVLRPSRGTAWLFGRDLSGLSRREVARRVAVVSQASEVVVGFRVEQVVMMGRSPHQGGLQLASAEDERAVRQAMLQTGVLELRGRPVKELSGGEQKMVALARAFAQLPEVLLLDEPSAHLDPRHSVGVFELVVSEVRRRNVACVAIAHDLNLAAAFADRILLLVVGSVRALGPLDEVMTAEHLAGAFGDELRVENTRDGPYFVPRRRRGPDSPDTRPSRGTDL